MRAMEIRVALLVWCLGIVHVGVALAAESRPGSEFNAASEKKEILWQRLAAQVHEIEGRLDGVVGVAILDLATGKEFLLHPDVLFPQASSIKIAILAELFHQAEESARGSTGKARLSDLYTVQSKDIVPDSDILAGLTPGVTQLTNRDLATMMVAVSDNAATNVLISRLGIDNVNALMGAQGLQKTQLRRKMMDLKAATEGRENVSTPREMMTLLERLYHGKVMGKAMSDDFFNVLATHKDSWLPLDLPEELRIANKPGALEGVRADSGIVFLSDRPYVICVMTTYLGNERAGEQTIREISALSYRMFDRLARASDYGRVISPANGGVR